MKIDKTIKIIFLTLVLTVSITRLFSQPPPPPPPPPCVEPCNIPLDGGISFLIAAGLAYGGKKTLDARKRNS